MAEIVDIRFKFGLDAKPLADAQAKTSAFAQELAEARQELAGLGEKGLAGVRDADLVLTKAAATVELLGLRLLEVEDRAATAAVRLKEAKEGTAAWRQAAAQLAEAEAEAAALQLQLKAVTAQLEQAGRSGAGLRGMSTGLMRVGQVASGLGFGQAAGVALLANDILDAADALPQLAKGIVDLGQTARGAGGVVGGLANLGAAAASALPGVSAGLGAIVAVAAPVAVAVGGIVAAISLANRAYEGQREEIRRYVASLDAYREARRLTTEEVQDRLSEAERTLADAQADLAEAQAKEAAAWQQETGLILGDLGARIRVALTDTGVEDLAANTVEAQKRLDAAQAAVDGYSRALDDNVTAANDAAAAAEKAAAERARQAEHQAELELRLGAQVNAMTAQQVNARLNDLQRERLIYQALVDQLTPLAATSEDAAAALAQAQTHLGDLAAESAFLIESVLPAAAMRDREAQALADLDAELQRELQTRELARTATREQVREQLAARERERSAIEAMLPRFQALADTSQDAAQRVTELTGRLSAIDAEVLALEDVALPAAFANEARQAWQEGVRVYGQYQDALADLEANAMARRAEIVAAGGEKLDALMDRQAEAVTKLEADIARSREKALRDFADKEQDLREREQFEDMQALKQHQRQLRNLAIDRNVAAFIAAEEDMAFQKEQVEAERAFEAKERQEDLDESLAEIKSAGQERLAEIKAQHQEQLAAQRAAQAEQLADLDANLEKERARRREALEGQLVDLEAGLAGQTDAAAAGYAQLSADFAAFLGGMGEGVDLLLAAGAQAATQSVDAQAATLEAAYNQIVDDAGLFAKDLQAVHDEAQATGQAALEAALGAERDRKAQAAKMQALDQQQALERQRQAARTLYEKMADDYRAFVLDVAGATAKLTARLGDAAEGLLRASDLSARSTQTALNPTPTILSANGGSDGGTTYITVHAPSQNNWGAVETPATANARLARFQQSFYEALASARRALVMRV